MDDKQPFIREDDLQLICEEEYDCLGNVRLVLEPRFFPEQFKSHLQKRIQTKKRVYLLLQTGNLVIGLWQDTKHFTAI